MTSPNRTGASLIGWIDEPWAIRGQSVPVFFQNVLVRYCPALINPIFSRINEELVTTEFDFWSDAGIANCIYRAYAMLLGWDWSLLAFIGCQDSVFVQRLNKQSLHEYNRGKQLLENFTEFCDFRNLRLGDVSRRFDVS